MCAVRNHLAHLGKDGNVFASRTQDIFLPYLGKEIVLSAPHGT
jgi:hypothetical protein